MLGVQLHQLISGHNCPHMNRLLCLASFLFFSLQTIAQVPADEDFSDDAATNGTNGTNSLTIDGVDFFGDVNKVELIESSVYALKFSPGTNAIMFNYDTDPNVTYFGFKTASGSEFRLSGLIIDVLGSSLGPFSETFVIAGLRNGGVVVSGTINFATSGTNGGITYTREPLLDQGGLLVFESASEWSNIDEIRFVGQDGIVMMGALKAIDFEAAIIVPVDLINYDARLLDNGSVKISWQTSSEKNNHYFSIEKSNDGRQFSEIGKVSGRGTTNFQSDYSFSDFNPSHGVNFYRLVQYDIDGKKKVEAIKIVHVERTGTIRIMPNPINSSFTINIGREMTRSMDYSIIDVSGRIVTSGILNNSIENINISWFKAGLYFLKLADGTTIRLQKL